MDDLDLERLKKELDDVSGGSQYDVDDIMREAGVSEPKQDKESLEQLMQRFGIHMEETPAQPAADTAGSQPGGEDLSALFEAAAQTQEVIDQQNELAEDSQEQPDQPDPLEEQDNVFAQLFNQLGQIERDSAFDQSERQTEYIDPRTQMPEEPEDEPDLMARLFDQPLVSQEQPQEEPEIQPQVQTTVRWEMPETLAEDTDLFTSAVRHVQEPVEEGQEEEQPVEQPEQKPEKKGFWTKWFGTDDDDTDDTDHTDDTEDTEDADDGQESNFSTEQMSGQEQSEPTEVFQPVEEPTQMVQPIDSEPELEAAEDAQDEQPVQEPEKKPEKKGFWTRWFGTGDDDDDDDTYDENQEDGTEDTEDAGDGQETELPEQEIQPVTETVYPEEETAPEETVLPEQAERPAEPEEVYFEPEPDEIEEQEDTGLAAFAEAMAQEEAIGATEETLETPHEPEPQDIPVISEEELEEFLSGVEQTPEEPIASFEEILREGGMESETLAPAQKKISFKEFPDEETTVYFDIPVREKPDVPPQPPELFDAEAALQQDQEAEAAAQREREARQPIVEPEWLKLSFEELCKTAPALEELRQEGPVMQREVARQREWILERHRAYMREMHPETQTNELAAEQDEPAPEEAEPSAIDAAGELRALLEQERAQERAQEQLKQASDSVFNDRPDGTPETEPDGREKNIMFPEQQEQPEQSTQPEQHQKRQQSEGLEQPALDNAQPSREQQSVRKTAKKQQEIPRDLRKAAASWKQRAKGQAQRSMVVAVLTIIAVYVSCAADFSLPLPASMDYVDSPNAVLISFIVLQLLAMLVALDIVWDGVKAAVQLSPNFSTLVDLALVLNLIHCMIRLMWDGEEMPYACAAMLALFAQMRARVSGARTRHYTCKVAAGSSQPVGIYCRDGSPKHIIKAPMDSVEPFVRQMVQPNCVKEESILTVLAAVLAVVLSVIVCVSTGDAGRLIYVLAATMTGACQVALLAAVPMARANAARHMMKGGAALDGIRSALELSSAGTVVLTDDDLFPKGSVALERLELHSQLNDATALAYAAALAGESSLGHMLAEEVRARYGAPLVAHHVVRYTGGGIGGSVGGLQILLGGADFMAERGLSVGELPDNGLALTVEGELAAVLVVDYQVPAVLFNAMQVLTERHVRILLHTRNHQVTPQLVERLYGLHEGTVILPELETDRAMRSPQYAAEGRLCGIMLRDGLVPFADSVSTAQGQTRLATVGLLIGIGAAIICMLLMAYLCFVFVPADARPIRVLLYAILCYIPIFFLESGVGRD